MSEAALRQRILQAATRQFEIAMEEQMKILLHTVDNVCERSTCQDQQLDLQLFINEIKEVSSLVSQRLREAVQHYIGCSNRSDVSICENDRHLLASASDKLNAIFTAANGTDTPSNKCKSKPTVVSSKHAIKRLRCRKRKGIPLKLPLKNDTKKSLKSVLNHSVPQEGSVTDGNHNTTESDEACIQVWVSDVIHNDTGHGKAQFTTIQQNTTTSDTKHHVANDNYGCDFGSDTEVRETSDLNASVSLNSVRAQKTAKSSAKVRKKPVQDDVAAFQCTLCSEAFRSKYFLKQHQHKLHVDQMDKNVCSVCHAPFPSESLLLEHAKCHCKKKRNCDICERTFSSSARYRDHLGTRAHYERKKERLKSHSVGESEPAGLNEDTEDASLMFPNTTRVCSVCGQRFSSKSSLYNHMNSIHSANTDYMCDICGKSWNCRAKLSAHMDIHLKRYKCDLCGETFSQKRLRDSHRRIHTGEQPFKCPHCPKAFREGYLLRKHVKTHSTSRPFTCDICHAMFKLKGHLQRHTAQVHSSDRPHKCDYCDESFTEKRLLQKHLFQHTGRSELRCSFCAKFLANEHSLKTHIMQYHKDEQQTEQQTPQQTEQQTPQQVLQQADATTNDAVNSCSDHSTGKTYQNTQLSFNPDTVVGTTTNEYTLNADVTTHAAAYFLQPVDPLQQQQFIITYPSHESDASKVYNGEPPTTTAATTTAAVTFDSQVILQQHQQSAAADTTAHNVTPHMLLGDSLSYQTMLTSDVTTESDRQLLQHNHAFLAPRLAAAPDHHNGHSDPLHYGTVLQYRSADEQFVLNAAQLNNSQR